MNLKKLILLSGLIALSLNCERLPLFQIKPQQQSLPSATINAVEPQPMSNSEVAQESNSKFKELKKLLTCFKSKDGCSKKQVAAIVGTISGIVLLITGGAFVGYQLLKKGKSDASQMNLFEMIASGQPITEAMLQGITKEQVNTKNDQGQTAIMLAIQKEDNQLTGLLIERGADITATDKEGKTLSDYIPENKSDVGPTVFLLLKKVYPKSWEGTQAEKETAVVDYIASILPDLGDWQDYIRLNALKEEEAETIIKNVEDRVQQMASSQMPLEP